MCLLVGRLTKRARVSIVIENSNHGYHVQHFSDIHDIAKLYKTRDSGRNIWNPHCLSILNPILNEHPKEYLPPKRYDMLNGIAIHSVLSEKPYRNGLTRVVFRLCFLYR